MNKVTTALKCSVVVPVKNASGTIGYCLDAIYLNEDVDFEVIVVDDGCMDNTMDVVSKYECRVLKNNVYGGVSGARNTGAYAAKGDVLVFIDSDIVIPKDALSKISTRIQHNDTAAVIGMLNEKIRFNNFASQYKNLWMNYTFNNLSDNVSLIFSSVAGIKKDIFLKYGGFDINYKFPNVEDNELGMRLTSIGYNIILDKTLQAEHLKRYTLWGLLKTHYFRAKGLAKLYHRKKLFKLSKSNPTSVPSIFLLNIPLSIVLIIFISNLLRDNNFSLKIMMITFLFAALISINYKWLHFLKKGKSPWFAFKSIFYLPIELLVVLFALVVGQIEYLVGKKY